MSSAPALEAPPLRETVRPLSVEGVGYSYRLLRQPDPVTEPVVVLGGALQGMHGWPVMDETLGPLASVVTADLPGMGSADPLPDGPGVDLLARALAAIVDDLGAPRVNLFGFSYGTAVAFALARRHPGRIARLMLGGVPCRIDADGRARWQRAFDRLTAGDRTGFAALAADSLMCLDPQRHVHRRELARRYVRRSFLHALDSPHAAQSLRRATEERPDFAGGIEGVTTLVFTGEHDTVTTPRDQRAFADTIEGSRFATIDDSDHWVVLERPDAVAELAADFFTDRLPAARLGPQATATR
ncbi:alpha/beta fold hydrolase [Streptomyces sp. NPDC060194]|uniref:alpha/beta fold hydrolase n=1 Tax=Streptomyces sp. NPDC060194 TaxID=3347069 RepID=UPI003657AB75